MRAHVLNENGKIIDTLMVSYLAEGMVDADVVGGGIGDSIIDGVLVVAPPPAGPSFADQKAEYFAEVREMRERLLNRLAGITTGIIASEPPEQAEVRVLYITLRQALLDITSIPPVASATTFPALKAAVKAEYARLVLLANETSQDFVKAFREVDE